MDVNGIDAAITIVRRFDRLDGIVDLIIRIPFADRFATIAEDNIVGTINVNIIAGNATHDCILTTMDSDCIDKIRFFILSHRQIMSMNLHLALIFVDNIGAAIAKDNIFITIDLDFFAVVLVFFADRDYIGTSATHNSILAAIDFDSVPSADRIFLSLHGFNRSIDHKVFGRSDTRRKVGTTTVTKDNVIGPISLAGFADGDIVITISAHDNVMATDNTNGIFLSNRIICCLDLFEANHDVIFAPRRCRTFVMEVHHTIVAKNNVLFSGYRDIVATKATDNNTHLSAGSNFIDSALVRHYGRNRSRPTGNAIGLLLDEITISILRNSCENNITRFMLTGVFLIIAKLRNDIIAIHILDVTLVTKGDNTLINIDGVVSRTAQNNHTVLGNQASLCSNLIVAALGVDNQLTVVSVIIRNGNIIIGLTIIGFIVAGIHDRERLEFFFCSLINMAMNGLRDIDGILTCTQIEFAKFELACNNLFLEFCMRKLDGIVNAFHIGIFKSAVGIDIRILVIHEYTINTVVFAFKEVILLPSEHSLESVQGSFNRLVQRESVSVRCLSEIINTEPF